MNGIVKGHNAAEKTGEEFSWDVVTYKAILDDGTPLWPSWFGHKEMERKKKFYADSGTPHKFYQEYMMEVQSEDDSLFTRDHIKYWDGTYMRDKDTGISYIIPEGEDPQPCSIFVGVDPATDSARRNTDFSVLLTIAITPNNNIYVIDYIRDRALPVLAIPGTGKKGIVDHIFELAEFYNPQMFTIEDTSMSKPVFQAIYSEMRRRNQFNVNFKAEPPGNRMSKRDRIQEILAQRFSVGQIHLKKIHYDLNREIITFGPRMAHDDTIDALAYACKYSHPPSGLGENKEGWYKKKREPRSWVTA